jgi:hypothetical protein
VRDGGAVFFDFEKLWEAYPKHEAKPKALSAMKQLQRKGELPPLSKLLEAIERFKLTQSWQRENGRFIPQLSNWLIGQRWLDAFSSEEEEAVRLRLERQKHELARKAEEEAREAEHKAERERFLPIYEAFKAQFPAEERSKGGEAYLLGKWRSLHDKYGGPTAAEVPKNNTQSIADFMKGYQRQRDESAYYAARAAVAAKEQPKRTPSGSFLSRLFPVASPLCAAV